MLLPAAMATLEQLASEAPKFYERLPATLDNTHVQGYIVLL
jgi:hypothetical protein